MGGTAAERRCSRPRRGSGAIAAQMHESRPDLSFCLVDNNQAQLELADPLFYTHCCDICDVPEPDSSFDALIGCYSIGYVRTADFFKEAARLLRPRGIVFLVDMVPASGTVDEKQVFGYLVRSRPVLEAAARLVNLTLDFYMEPIDSTGWGESQFPGYFHVFFGDLKPAVYRFTSREHHCRTHQYDTRTPHREHHRVPFGEARRSETQGTKASNSGITHFTTENGRSAGESVHERRCETLDRRMSATIRSHDS